MSPALGRVLDELRSHGCDPQQNGTGWAAKCPAHDDRRASLSVSEGAEHPVVVHCHAGCATSAVLHALGLDAADLCDDGRETTHERRIVASYDYRDESGKLLYQVVRFDPKDFRPRRPDGSGGWTWKLGDVRRVLYGLANVAETVRNGGTIYIVEGEKDADAINAADPDHAGAFVATTNAGGAGKWRPEYGDVLRGARVVVVADRDEPGRKHALDVRHHLQGVAATVEIVEAAEGKDAADHLAAGRTLDELKPVSWADTRQGEPLPIPRAVDLWSPEIIATRPTYTVSNLIRRAGLHLIWAEPSGGKTWTLLRWMHELLLPRPPATLTSHPDLKVRGPYRRVLWIATEEDAGTLKYKAEAVLRGLDAPEIGGTFKYLFAPGSGRRITLDDLPSIVDVEGPLDAVILDSLTGLRPKTVNGERVRWDLDNDAANDLCLRLRALATEKDVSLALVHHTGRDTAKGYRGPTDWWASADVMFGFVPDAGRSKVIVGKNRDGKRVLPFYLAPAWNGDAYTLKYDGEGVAGKLTPTANAVHLFIHGAGRATRKQIEAAVGAARSTVQEAIGLCLTAGLLKPAGKDGKEIVYADTCLDGTSDSAYGAEVPGSAGQVPETDEEE